MDDDKYYTLQVKGKAYRFKPLPPEDITRIGIVFNLNVSSAKILKALTRMLASSAGEDQWDELTDRYVSGELAVEEITVGIFKRLAERQNKDAPPVDDAE